MSVVFIEGNPPQYQMLSTDITSGSIVSGGGDRVGYIGAIAFCTDTGDFYRVIATNTLAKLPNQVALNPDLALLASNLILTLSNSKGSAVLANTSKVLGVYTSSSSIRVGLELPDTTTGSCSGSAAVTADWKKGALVESNEWNWYNVGYGVSRVVYFMSGSPADTVKLIQM